jgi:nitrate reductase gamma subunit
MGDLLLFGVFPYLAIALAVVVSIWRYRTNQFSYSSLSSQFLEGRTLFWGSVPWHIGIGSVLIGHLIGIVFPSSVKAFNGTPIRLFILEGTALALGVLALLGLVLLLIRRGTNDRVLAVTSKMDVLLLVMLLAQVLTGLGIAVFHRWGSFWFVQTAAPYFWSLVTLNPNVTYVASMPLLVKLHAIGAFALVAVFPFSRLVHLASAPFAYLWRPYQVVVWNRGRSGWGTETGALSQSPYAELASNNSGAQR